MVGIAQRGSRSSGELRAGIVHRRASRFAGVRLDEPMHGEDPLANQVHAAGKAGRPVLGTAVLLG